MYAHAAEAVRFCATCVWGVGGRGRAGTMLHPVPPPQSGCTPLHTALLRMCFPACLEDRRQVASAAAPRTAMPLRQRAAVQRRIATPLRQALATTKPTPSLAGAAGAAAAAATPLASRSLRQLQTTTRSVQARPSLRAPRRCRRGCVSTACRLLYTTMAHTHPPPPPPGQGRVSLAGGEGGARSVPFSCTSRRHVLICI